jgi:hypothetical protein
MEWDFTGQDRWQVPVVAESAPIALFDGARDRGHVLHPHPWSYVPFRTDLVPGSGPGALALFARVEDFTPAPHHFALRTFLPESERTRLTDAPEEWVLRIRARAAEGGPDRLEVALVERDGTAWGSVVDLGPEWRDYEIPAEALRRVPLALLPRPYPQFLPYRLTVDTDAEGPRIVDLDGLQFAVGAELFGGDREKAHGFQVERVVLEGKD